MPFKRGFKDKYAGSSSRTHLFTVVRTLFDLFYSGSHADFLGLFLDQKVLSVRPSVRRSVGLSVGPYVPCGVVASDVPRGTCLMLCYLDFKKISS